MRVSVPSRPARGLAAVGLGVSLLAGCGGGSAPATQQEQGSSRTAAEVVQAATSATEQAGSSRFSLESVTEVGAQSVTFSGEGLTDAEGREGSATFTLPQGAGTLEQRFLDDVLYLQVPGQPGWFRLALADLVGTPFESAAQPTGSLDALRSAGADVEEAGEEDVRGEPTTRYTGTVDAEEALGRLDGALRDLADQGLGAAASGTFPFELWIDGQDRVRRFRLTVELPASEATGGQPVSSETTVELYDFGVDVAVEPPPADEVQDGAPLLEALTGGQG